MNIFVVNEDPRIAAKELCDKHVIKMILESAQMLCSAFPDGDAPYKQAYVNHPCTKWARETKQNYQWLMEHASGLCKEYQIRYGKQHKSWEAICWCLHNYDKLKLPDTGRTKFIQAMPDKYKNPCATTAYQNYYNGEKSYFAKWRNGNVPAWFTRFPSLTAQTIKATK